MRNFIIGLILALITIVSISIIYTNDGRNIREQEVTNSLDTAVEGTVSTLMKKTYSIDNSDQFVADMLEALVMQIDSECTLKVNVLDVDYDKGLLSVEAVETFKHPNGKTGTVSCTKTVILEHLATVTDPATDTYTVEFYIPDTSGTGETLYKKLTLKKGAVLQKPSNPDLEGKTFKGWALNGSEFTFLNGEGESYKINQNLILKAKFE